MDEKKNEQQAAEEVTAAGPQPEAAPQDEAPQTEPAAPEAPAEPSELEKAQAAFLSSPGHRRNVLSSRYTRFGVGIAADGSSIYLTQIFCR